jgi:ELWxxDGT repeat protein
MITTINASRGGLSPKFPVGMGSTLYFVGNDGTHGAQLWRSSGTRSGTSMVADINGTAGSYANALTHVGGTLYFSAYTSTYGYQIWQSNGTSSGTVMDTSMSGGKASAPSNLVALGSMLCFQDAGASLWALGS